MIDGSDDGTDERLRRIEALTDTSLSQLDPSAMLDELLNRVRDVLHADTAVLLLLDPHAQQLVVTIAKGVERRVPEGYRVPLGGGFSGRVAFERRPVAVADVAAAGLDSPLLLDTGTKALMGVPMFAAGELIGVLNVGSFTPRKFTDEDMRLLKLAADRASTAAQARASGIDRTAALALQRSLLPTRLPESAGVEIASRYVPGHDAGVSGDWYDVFSLPTGWLGVVIGDVSGHGLRSAVVMGRLRSALRAYSLICDDPADALTLLDRKVRHFEAGNLATVMYAMVSPDRETLRVSLAGHFQPVIAEPDRPAVLADIPVDLPLGLGGRYGTRRCTDLSFPPGSVLVGYTDGLIERRSEVIDAGLERLRAIVAPEAAERVCSTVMAALAEERPDDDIALLAIRRV